MSKRYLKFLPVIICVLVIVSLLSWPIFISPGTNKNQADAIVSKIIKLSDTSSSPLKTPVVIETEPENILVFGGDIMLSRTVNAKMENYSDYSWPFLKIYPLFNEADLAIANLESPFLFTNNYKVLTGSFAFKANPKSVSGLTLAGFDVLSLANNHTYNQGAKGVADTKKVLGEAGIAYSGLSLENLVVKESKGVKFAFLSYTYADDSSLIANMLDFSRLELDIKKAKNSADVLIVLMHAGTEYVSKANWQQKDFAHAAVDYGADLVVGSHPHWPQSVENYQGKTIIYSLGNLVFDQMWSPETSAGLVAKTYFTGKKLEKIEYLPVSIKNYGQVELMSEGVEKDNLLKKIGL